MPNARGRRSSRRVRICGTHGYHFCGALPLSAQAIVGLAVAMLRASHPPAAGTVIELDGGERAMTTLLARPNPPTAVFAMSEMAVVSSRKARLQRMADDGFPGAKSAMALNEEPSAFLSTVQVGALTATQREENRQQEEERRKAFAQKQEEYERERALRERKNYADQVSNELRRQEEVDKLKANWERQQREYQARREQAEEDARVQQRLAREREQWRRELQR